MSEKRGRFVYSIFWNCGLITIGTLIQAIALKAIAIPHNFVPSGLFGVGSLLFYKTGFLNPGLLYLVLNVPMFILGYIFISRRFLWYSALAMGLISLFYQLIDFQIAISHQLYAALVFGALLGVGAGMVLRSLGSNGGLDVAAVILNQKFNIGVGKVYFGFNLVLFCLSLASLDNDLVIASIIAVFVCSAGRGLCPLPLQPAQAGLHGFGEAAGDRRPGHDPSEDRHHHAAGPRRLPQEGKDRADGGHQQHPAQTPGGDRLHHGQLRPVYRREHLLGSRFDLFAAEDLLTARDSTE